MHSIPASPLGQFFGSYLHQDWTTLYPDPWSAVADYVAKEPFETRALARIELAELLAGDPSEADLERAADRLGLVWYPPGAGFTYRKWLEKVARYLREHEH